MTDRTFTLERYGWRVRVLLGVTDSDEEYVLRILRRMGSDVTGGGRGRGVTGATYSSFLNRMTLIIVGFSGSIAETLDTFVHETVHAAMHIAEAEGIGPYGEEPCYIAGGLAGRCAEDLLRIL